MELAEIERRAVELMAEHGLAGWTFAWDRAVRRAGQTNFRRRRITLSRHLMPLCSEGQVVDTILHEIAHALAGPDHGHDLTWKRVALAVGAKPQRCTTEDFPRVDAPIVGTCPRGHTHSRFRKPTRPLSCRKCSPSFSYQHVVTWKDVRKPEGAQAR